MHNLKTSSTGTVHAAVDGRPACPTRTKTAHAYSDTTDAVTCGHCLKLLAEVQRIEAEAAGETITGPRHRIATARRLFFATPAVTFPAEAPVHGKDDVAPKLVAAANLPDISWDEQPAEIRDDLLLVAMSLGMLLGLEAVDEYGYESAERIMWRMSRRELTTFDIAEMSATFREVFLRRQDAKQCSEGDCLMCEAVA
ncbi:hypothetical protein [Streptosporangium sp. NPDC002524]|uniref:hypothetical protein n=1 Tax=Streptosporangium sp. NPDC002524 TaxID=3154537 RepID=UPI00331C3A58